MSLNQASNSSLSQSSFQPFDSLPDEVLLLLLDQLTPFQRCLTLSICKKWNYTILQRKSWWQYLDVPDHLPFSTALSILQTFSSRSNFTLRHVTLQPIMETSEEIDEVFAELKKSSGHVKLLFLNQSDFMTKARRAAQKSLPELNTFYLVFTRYAKHWRKSMWQQRVDSKVQDEGENGLQLLQVRELGQLEPDDLEWFSKLKCVSLGLTSSVADLRAILEVAKMTLVTLRLDFWVIIRDLDGLDSAHTEGFNRIDLPNLRAIFTPNSEASAAALSSLIDVEGQQSVVFYGYVHSLLYFGFLSLERVRIRMYERKDLEILEQDGEESELKTTRFFERNPSISLLSLDGVTVLQDGESFHLNFILQSLSMAKINRNLDESEEKSQKVRLPKLQKLTISNLKNVNKGLLKQFWETRKAICNEFKIQVHIEGKIFEVDHSGGEEWLDEAEC